MTPLIPYQIDIPREYHRFILWISDKTGLADNLLHIHSGLAIFVLARLITRRPYSSFIPFLCVVLAEASNEILDYLAYGWRPTDTYFDIANTLFWPLMISLTERMKSVSKRDNI
jgi:hypothetical protein